MILAKFDLTGRAAIVTGGGQGIGKAIALALAEAGADVVVADKDAELGEGTASEIRAMGRRALAATTDVRQAEQVNDMVERCRGDLGRLDILVNNAGGFFVAPALEISENGWDAVVRLCLKSVFVCSKAAANVMREQKKGCILNIASASGQGASPMMAHYAAAKAGVINLTQTLAMELAPFIRVNAIAPGAILTPGTAFLWEPERRSRVENRIPRGRLGQPEDIAAAALYLTSDASDYVTGQILGVNGGPQIPSYLDTTL